MWKDLDAIQKTHDTPKERRHGNQLTFGAMDYAANQVMMAGYSVIYDCNANKYRERQKTRQIALDNGGRAFLVYIKTPRNLAVQRTMERNADHDQRQFTTLEKAEQVVDRFIREIEQPLPEEYAIEIDGTLPFEEQRRIFERACS